MGRRHVAAAGAVAALVLSAAPAHAQGPFGDGTHQVGTTIAPGLYRTLGGDACYWARSSDASGSVESIIANRFKTAGRAVVEVQATDAVFLTQGCGTWWPVVDGDVVPMSSVGDGDYLVGRDIEPGTYTTAGGDGCYWARSSDASGSVLSITANQIVTGPAVVEVAADDVVFSTERCGTWTRQ